jgi:hypothetical protein
MPKGAILNSLLGALNRRGTRRARIRNSQFSINPLAFLMQTEHVDRSSIFC